MGFWNVNGWSENVSSDNFIFRENCIINQNHDIIAIKETHLKGKSSLQLDDYNFYGNNRKDLHVNARAGSGGVCLLVNKSLAHIFNIEVLNKNYAEIL